MKRKGREHMLPAFFFCAGKLLRSNTLIVISTEGAKRRSGEISAVTIREAIEVSRLRSASLEMTGACVKGSDPLTRCLREMRQLL